MYKAYQNKGKRSEKLRIYLKSCLSCINKPIKCLLSNNGQCYVQTLYNIWSISRLSNRILLQPFDSVLCLFRTYLWHIMAIKSDHALSIPPPLPPFKDGSNDENECSNSLTLDCTKINDLSYYQKLGASTPHSKE